MKFTIKTFIQFVLLLSIATMSHAADNFTPITGQTVITQPGSYILEDDINVPIDEIGIIIQADNVSLDLNAHHIQGPTPSSGLGIFIQNAKGVHVFNGHISGFGIGAYALDSRNVRMNNLTITGQDLVAVLPDIEIGILLIDTGASTMTQNIISDTFLGIFVRGDESQGNSIFENNIAAGDNGELGICFNPGLSGTGGPQGNRTFQNHISRFNTGIQTNPDSQNNIFSENTVMYFTLGIEEVVPNANTFIDNTLVQLSP